MRGGRVGPPAAGDVFPGEQDVEGNGGTACEGSAVLCGGQRSVPRHDGGILRALRRIQAPPGTPEPPLPGCFSVHPRVFLDLLAMRPAVLWLIMKFLDRRLYFLLGI